MSCLASMEAPAWFCAGKAYLFTIQDVAATSLFVACKIEDTLKKSREILCASYNLRHPQVEPINSDNPVIPKYSAADPARNANSLRWR